MFLATALLFPACTRRETAVEAGTRAQILHQGIGAEPQDVDPHLTQFNSHFNIAMALGEGLVGYDPRDLHPIPGVAERWEISPDGLGYTFHLRAGARWSNGDALTADDFVFSARRMLSPALGSAFRFFYDDVRGAKEFSASDRRDFSTVGIRALDARTLRIELEHPTPYFLFLLGNPSWYPVHRTSVEAAGPFDRPFTGWTKPGRMVNNGPFDLAAWRAGQVIIVKKNPRYWGAAGVRLNEIHFYPVENADAEERMFRSGQLHLTENVPSNKIPVYASAQPPVLDVSPFFANYTYAFNTRRPPFTDARVRRAFSLAIDRERFIASQPGSGIRAATSLIPPGVDGYTYSGEPVVRCDPAEARRLLAEAGYPDGRGFPAVDISINTNARHQEFAQIVQQMWRQELGVRVNIVNKEGKVFYDERLRGEFQICRSGWVGDYIDASAFLTNYLSTSGHNEPRYANPEFDHLVTTGTHMPDHAARLARYREAEAMLLRDAPVAPIFWDTAHHLVSPAIRGRFPTILDFHPYQHIWLEK
ncbi:MAG: peptide ABC transporter substrate-binding protein [Opitutus sp.]|nr:peptide ABC transporter substrate-binding protein [Opitutus sp.]